MGDKMAVILGIGTANPPNCISQEEYLQLFSGVDHSAQFIHKITTLCEKSGIKRRYLHLTEDILRENPSLATHGAPSLELRQKISEEEIPRLGGEAAVRAIQDWGQPKSDITHLIFCAIQAVHMPGADLRLTVNLGLRPSVSRIMLYHQGCYVSISALRLAKDIVENNPTARVLVVCCDTTIGSFRMPCEDHMEDIEMQTMFGDGAAAVIVGATVNGTERPLFRMVTGAQTIIPDSDGALCGHVDENGFSMDKRTKIPGFIASAVGYHVNNFLTKMLRNGNINTIEDWNSVFWVMQATAKPMLDRIEAELQLQKDKLEDSREVWREYGYMMSTSTLFVLNEVKKKLSEKNEGSGYGVMLGFGAGLTLEAIVLQRVVMPLPASVSLSHFT